MANKIVVDCATGKAKIVQLTAAEESQRGADAAAEAEAMEREEVARLARQQREADIEAMLAEYRLRRG